jgi:hypothetical protein
MRTSEWLRNDAMAKHRDKLPDDLKELVALCRAGRLFEVQERLAAGQRFRPPPGNYLPDILAVVVDSGFHSLVELFLRQALTQEERDWMLRSALANGRADLVHLAVAHGANPLSVSPEEVFSSHNPPLIRWFVAHGLDLEDGWPVAEAFRFRNRQVLGVYMDNRERLPSLKTQAAAALRYHCRRNDMKWVLLLRWAGADPRLPVMDLENPDQDESEHRSALQDAVWFGRTEIVRKIGFDAARDSLNELLELAAWGASVDLITDLLALAEASGTKLEFDKPVRELMGRVEFELGGSSHWSPKLEPCFAALKLLADKGGRWRPENGYHRSRLRRSLAKVDAGFALKNLGRFVDLELIEPPVFKDLVKARIMRELLADPVNPDAKKIRAYVGLREPPAPATSYVAIRPRPFVHWSRRHQR